MFDIVSKGFEPLPDTMNWEPELRPIQTDGGEEVSEHRFRGVYRGDYLIAPVGPNYRTASHVELIAAVDESFEDAGIDLSGVERTVEMLENGAKFQAIYRLKNYVVRPKVGDEMEKTYVFRTSHDMSWSNSLEYKLLRLICLNGMVTADKLATMRAKHTSGFNANRFVRQIRRGIEMMTKEEEFFRKLAATRVTREEAEWFVRETIAKRPKPFIREGKNGSAITEYAYEKKVQAIMDQFSREDQTAFGVYNALTYWSTHTPARSGAEHNALLHREKQVIEAVSSPEFAKIAA